MTFSIKTLLQINNNKNDNIAVITDICNFPENPIYERHSSGKGKIIFSEKLKVYFLSSFQAQLFQIKVQSVQTGSDEMSWTKASLYVNLS